jgi:hypothetical protein
VGLGWPNGIELKLKLTLTSVLIDRWPIDAPNRCRPISHPAVDICVKSNGIQHAHIGYQAEFEVLLAHDTHVGYAKNTVK